MHRRTLVGTGLLLLAAALPRAAAGQGVTTSAVAGTIRSQAGEPLASIQVVVRNTQTGAQTGTLSGANGRYFIQGLQPGGPYTVRAEAIGYAPQEIPGVHLVLSQTARLDFTLAQQAVQIAGIEVQAERSGVFTQDHTGPATTISDSLVSRMPTLTRNFTDFARTSPMVVGGSSSSVAVGGQNNRFNNIEIDGAVTNDLFGLGSTGSVGGQVNGKPISADAIQQYQVLAAPFDVRHGGFTGGLINAVTRSGTNQLKGSFFFFGRNQSFMNDLPYFDAGVIKFRPSTDFSSSQWGGSLGGPLMKDKVHFFVNGEVEGFNRPLTANSIGREAFSQVGVVADSAARFQQILSGGAYNLTGGEYGAANLDNPKRNVFGRLDWTASARHRLTLRDSYSNAQDESYGTRSSTFYALSSNSYAIKNWSNSAVMELNSSFGNGLFNELLLNYEIIRDKRDPRGRFPEIDVTVTSRDAASGTSATRTLVAGGEFSSQANQLDQDVLEVTDNVTLVRGVHKVTFGTHNEFFKFRNLFFQGVWGTYRYASLADLAANKVASYSINVPVESQTLDQIQSRFSVRQLGGYVQDQITLSDGLTVLAGLRADAPLFPTGPRENPKFFNALGLHTSEVPSGKVLFSPRLGFNWDVAGDGQFQVRGGAGLFTGRPPYVWISNAFTNTGREMVSLSCAGTNPTNAPPAYNGSNPSPTQCAGGLSASTGGAAAINLIDEDFKFPQELKLSLGVDHRLPFGLAGTLEGLYTKAMHQVFNQELNLKMDASGRLQPIGTDPYGRPLYGTHNPATGAATPNRRTTDFLQVINLTNREDGYTYLISGSLTRRFTSRYELLAGYTFSHAYDAQSLTSSVATSNYGFNPIAGDPNAPPRTRSNFDMPHKLTFSGTATVLDIPRVGTTELSIIYTGTSGQPYNYTYNGDVNGDGYQATNISGRNNDLVFVPANQSQIQLRAGTASVDQQWQGLNAFIASDACLQDARGSLLVRNSCREPWHNRLDGRLAQSLPVPGRMGRLQIVADVFNILNLLSSDWGLYQIAPNNTINMLNLVGWDNVRNEGIFQWPGSVTNRQFLVPTSQWQIQLGGRYSF